MIPSLFILTRIFSNPFSNVLQKKLTGASSDPLFIILATHILLSLAALPVLLYVLPLDLSASFWANMFLCALLAVGGNTLIVAALKLSDLSVLGPINAYKSIVSLLLGIFLLGEIPTHMGMAGILLILLGSFFIPNRNPAQRQGVALLALLNDKGVRLRFAALVLSAGEAVFLKKALLLSSPLVTFLLWCILGVPVASLMATRLLKSGFRPEIARWRRERNSFLLLALTTGLMQLSTLYTFSTLQVGYSLALFQTSTLLSVIFGYGFFRERDIARRFLGAIIMIVGAILIVSFGSTA